MNLNPKLDARLAERLRDIAKWQSDSIIEMDGNTGTFTAEAKADVLNIAADKLEEYIMAYAQAMSAGTAETEGLRAEPASAVAESHAPINHPLTDDTCSCKVCNSDLKNIIPCEKDNGHG